MPSQPHVPARDQAGGAAQAAPAAAPQEVVRVVRIITRLNIGGPAHQALILSRDLDPSRFATTLVTGVPHRDEGDMTAEVRAAGVEPLIAPNLHRRLSWVDDVRTFLFLVRVLRRVRPAIVHTHMAKAGALGRLAAWLCRVPIRIHTFHGHVFHSYFSGWKSRAYVASERALAKLCECIVVLSPRQRQDICARYDVAPRQRIRIVPLGLELRAFAAAGKRRGVFRRQLGLDAATPLIGIVGRLVPVKDHYLFLDLAAALRRAWQETAPPQPAPPFFVIVGDGELRPDLERHCRVLGLAKCVRFCGWRRDLDTIYADLDVAVLTSRNEGLPVSLIESMAAGVPVVAAQVGGVADLLGALARQPQEEARGWSVAPYGVMVRSRQPVVWQAAVASVLRPSQAIRRRCERAQRQALEHYTAERLVANVEALYLELLRRKGLVQRRAPRQAPPHEAVSAPQR